MSGGAGGGRNKFSARACECSQGGTPHKHASLAERRRCFVLHIRQQQGDIINLRLHNRWPLEVNGQRVGVFTDDFAYEQRDHRDRWVTVIEDVKSKPTRQGEAYRLRKKIWEACYAPFTITEVE